MASYLTSVICTLMVSVNVIFSSPLPLTTPESGFTPSTVEPEGSSLNNVISTSQTNVQSTAEPERHTINSLISTSQDSHVISTSRTNVQSTTEPERHTISSLISTSQDSHVISTSQTNVQSKAKPERHTISSLISTSQEARESTTDPTRNLISLLTARDPVPKQKRSSLGPFLLKNDSLSMAIAGTQIAVSNTFEQFNRYSHEVAQFAPPLGNIDTLCGKNDISQQTVQDAKDCSKAQSVMLAILTVLDADVVRNRAMTASPIYHDVTPGIGFCLQQIAWNVRDAVPEDSRSSIDAAISTMQPPTPNLNNILEMLSCVYVQTNRLLDILSSLQTECSSPSS